MSNNDPTLDEMRAYLDGVMSDYEASEFDREEAIYWFACEYHDGQSSNLYAALSASEYKPGPLARGPEVFPARELYCELIVHFIEAVPIDGDISFDADKANELLTAIRDAMDGKEWSADTMQEIADLLTAAGITLREPQ